MRVLEDVTVGEWLRSRLEGWGVVGGVVPRGCEAVARVLHPAELSRIVGQGPDGLEVESRAVRWADVAEHFGRVAHPLMQWGSLTGDVDAQRSWGDDWLLNRPAVGSLERRTYASLLSTLRSVTPDVRWIAALWHGWSEVSGHPGASYVAFGDGTESRGAIRPGPLAEAATAVARRHTLSLPHREYVLIEGEPTELVSGAWFDGLGSEVPRMPTFLTPNLLWPEDRSWCLATEIDFDSTLVAGGRDLVDALLAHPELEVVEVGYDDDLGWHGDQVNPQPPS